MTENQKLIKNIAMGFAIFLTVMIIGGIFAAVSHIFSFGSNSSKSINVEYVFTEDISSIEVEHSVGNLFFAIGNQFEVEAVNVPDTFYYNVKSDGTLVIRDKRSNSFLSILNFKGYNSKVIITIPEDFIAESVKISGGAGNIDISDISTQYLKVEGGAGNITGTGVSASNVKIDSGVGNLDFTSVNLKNIDIDGGVGNIYLDGKVTGDNKINSGVGNVEIEVQGNVDDYNLTVSPGLGKVAINGSKVGEIRNTSSNSKNSFNIDGGVGNIKLFFYD